MFGQQAREQMDAAMRDIAVAIMGYYDKLIALGMEPPAALQLTIALQDSIIRGGYKHAGE